MAKKLVVLKYWSIVNGELRGKVEQKRADGCGTEWVEYTVDDLTSIDTKYSRATAHDIKFKLFLIAYDYEMRLRKQGTSVVSDLMKQRADMGVFPGFAPRSDGKRWDKQITAMTQPTLPFTETVKEPTETTQATPDTAAAAKTWLG